MPFAVSFCRRSASSSAFLKLLSLPAKFTLGVVLPHLACEISEACFGQFRWLSPPSLVILGAPQLPQNPRKFQRHSKVTESDFRGFPQVTQKWSNSLTSKVTFFRGQKVAFGVTLLNESLWVKPWKSVFLVILECPWIANAPALYRGQDPQNWERGFRIALFRVGGKWGFFWPRNPLLPIWGILTPVQGRSVRNSKTLKSD